MSLLMMNPVLPRRAAMAVLIICVSVQVCVGGGLDVQLLTGYCETCGSGGNQRAICCGTVRGIPSLHLSGYGGGLPPYGRPIRDLPVPMLTDSRSFRGVPFFAN